VCEDESLLGVPFYVMPYLDGVVLTEVPPPGLESEDARNALGRDLVDALIEIHAADVTTPALAAFARPGSYSERQVRRFEQLWEITGRDPAPGGRHVARRQRAGPASGDGRPRRLPVGTRCRPRRLTWILAA
jgi:aminoglycoside phosphotransferase (APT) family kinase protein